MHIVASNIDNDRSKQFLLDAGILNRLNEKEMLFDLYLDPMERENQADNSAYSWIHKQLSESLESWMKKTNDPLLKPSGVDVPKGAKINKRSCIHAEIPDYE